MDILFLIHPNFAVENWLNNPDKLNSYYNNVINTIKKFDGITIIHMMEPPRNFKRDVGSDESWDIYDEFIDKIESIKNDNIIIKWDTNKLGCTFGDEFDSILLTYEPGKILIGGGYYGNCLLQTHNELKKQYGSYLKDIGTKIYKIPSLIYVPGPDPHILSSDDVNEFQKEYTDRQGGSTDHQISGVDYKWDGGLPDSYEVSESVEVILDGEKYLIEKGDIIFLEKT